MTNFRINFFFLLSIFDEIYIVFQFLNFKMNSDIYFFIHYQRTQREDSDSIDFTFPEDEKKQPKCIFCNDDDYDEENNLYNYNKIFKAPKSNAKGKKNEYHFEFRISDDIYIIKFYAKKYLYIYIYL